MATVYDDLGYDNDHFILITNSTIYDHTVGVLNDIYIIIGISTIFNYNFETNDRFANSNIVNNVRNYIRQAYQQAEYAREALENINTNNVFSYKAIAIAINVIASAANATDRAINLASRIMQIYTHDDIDSIVQRIHKITRDADAAKTISDDVQRIGIFTYFPEDTLQKIVTWATAIVPPPLYINPLFNPENYHTITDAMPPI